MKRIRSALRDHVDHSPTVAAVFGGVIRSLYAKLLERVGKRKGHVHVGVSIDVVDSVKIIGNHVLAGSICGDLDGARKCLGLSLIGAAIGRNYRSWYQRSERCRIAAVQRQVNHSLGIDYLLDRGCVGIGLLGRSLNRHTWFGCPTVSVMFTVWL
jgi:hypothetical protein